MDRYDLLTASGGLFVAVGLGMISLPLAFVAVGLTLVGLGVLGARVKSRAVK